MKTEGLLKIIIVLLILFFCPVAVLAFFVAALGVYGVLLVGLFCAGGLIFGIAKLCVTPSLCKRVGFVGIALYLILSVLPLHFIPYFPLANTLILLASTMVLLLYQRHGMHSFWEVMALIFTIAGIVYHAFTIHLLRADYARELGIVRAVTILGLFLTFAGFLILMFKKPKNQGAEATETVIPKEERRSILLITAGAMCRMLVQTMLPFSYENRSAYSALAAVNSLTFLVIAVGFALYFMSGSFHLKKS